jgi:hypothetical protein
VILKDGVYLGEATGIMTTLFFQARIQELNREVVPGEQLFRGTLITSYQYTHFSPPTIKENLKPILATHY